MGMGCGLVERGARVTGSSSSSNNLWALSNWSRLKEAARVTDGKTKEWRMSPRSPSVHYTLHPIVRKKRSE